MGLVGRQNAVCLCDNLYHSVTGFVEDPGYSINPLTKERGFQLCGHDRGATALGERHMRSGAETLRIMSVLYHVDVPEA